MFLTEKIAESSLAYSPRVDVRNCREVRVASLPRRCSDDVPAPHHFHPCISTGAFAQEHTRVRARARVAVVAVADVSNLLAGFWNIHHFHHTPVCRQPEGTTCAAGSLHVDG